MLRSQAWSSQRRWRSSGRLGEAPRDAYPLCGYAGEDDDKSTRAAIRHVAPYLDGYIPELETCRDKVNHDVLRDVVFGPLVEMAMEGNLMAIVGGPNIAGLGRSFGIGQRKECQEWFEDARASRPGASGVSAKLIRRMWTTTPYYCSGCSSFTTSPFWRDTRHQRSQWNIQKTQQIMEHWTSTKSAACGGPHRSARASAAVKDVDTGI